VLNLSSKGALLEIPGRWSLPFKFELVIEALDLKSLCEIRHHRANRFGVRFVTDASKGKA
jgi:hypothetical protein